jgi:SAM-dependent methyltransferase
MTRGADWDEIYGSSEDHVFVSEPDAELVERVRDLPRGRAVDLGAGEGRNALWLAREGWVVTAVDFSKVALSRLQASADEAGLEIDVQRAEIEQYVREHPPFDLVVLANIHPAREERARVLAAAADAVADAGHLFLVGHHLDSLGRGGPPDPERLYREEDLLDALPGLEVLEMKRIDRAHGDIATPVVDLVVWARKVPAD